MIEPSGQDDLEEDIERLRWLIEKGVIVIESDGVFRVQSAIAEWGRPMLVFPWSRTAGGAIDAALDEMQGEETD